MTVIVTIMIDILENVEINTRVLCTSNDYSYISLILRRRWNTK